MSAPTEALDRRGCTSSKGKTSVSDTDNKYYIITTLWIDVIINGRNLDVIEAYLIITTPHST